MSLNPPFDELISETEIQTLRALYDRHRLRVHADALGHSEQ